VGILIRNVGMRLPVLMFLAIPLLAQQLKISDDQPQHAPVAVFGTTVVIPSGLKGEIFHLSDSVTTLAVLEKLKPVGTIYTSALNVPPQDFSIGFPGVTSRFEWFAIDYSGKFWVQKPGVYRFKLVADDGAMLYIDGQLIVDNDGIHSPEARRGSVRLAGGIHTIRVPYFQGPRHTVALLLEVAGPDDKTSRVFSTEEFKPPGNPEDWNFSAALPPPVLDRDLDRSVPERIPAPADANSKRNRRGRMIRRN
jgi:hypothetical protein